MFTRILINAEDSDFEGSKEYQWEYIFRCKLKTATNHKKLKREAFNPFLKNRTSHRVIIGENLSYWYRLFSFKNRLKIVNRGM